MYSCNFYSRYNSTAKGFSLVEVTLALAISVFCFLGLTGLLIAGLNSMNTTREENNAVYTLERISNAIRTSQTTDGVHYTGSGAFSNIFWKVGDEKSIIKISELPLNINDSNEIDAPKSSAYIEILPPSQRLSAGSALISIAWPSESSPQYQPAIKSWKKSQGSKSLRIIFLPTPPVLIP